jgi:hypothetical protein
LDQALVRGFALFEEVVFLHSASRTLILTDLCLNFGESDSRITRLVARLLGVYRRFGPSRSLTWFLRDRPAARASVQRILQWDFDRIIIAHGDIIEANGKAKFDEAFAWLVH